MEDHAVAAIAPLGVALLFQALKDNLNLNAGALKWVAAILGAIAGGGAGFAAGAADGSDLAMNTGLGAILATGLHSLTLQGSVLGKALKAIGAAFFNKASVPPSP